MTDSCNTFAGHDSIISANGGFAGATPKHGSTTFVTARHSSEAATATPQPVHHFSLKVAILGADGCGKTTLLRKQESMDTDLTVIAQKPKPSNLSPLPALDKPQQHIHSELELDPADCPSIRFQTSTYTMNDIQYRVCFWDCPGAERYRNLTLRYSAGAAGIMVVFDLTRRDTFEQACEWIKLAEETCPEAVMLLVANKDACQSSPRQISRATAEQFAIDHGFNYIETDALTNVKVHDAFRMLLCKIIEDIPLPHDAAVFRREGVKIGPALLTDKQLHRFASESSRATRHSQDKQSASYDMDWL